MFKVIRYRLLFSYLVVLTIILGVFAVAIRITFANSLQEELAERVTVLAKSSSGELDLEGAQLVVDAQDLLIGSNQAVQWFDIQGRLIAQRGNNVLALPLNPEQMVQAQTLPYPALGVTLSVREEEKDGTLIGYVRASESLERSYGTLRRLEWGLGGGIIMALALSGVGGVWLTRQAMQPIEQSFQRLQQFTSNAAHEIRSPLMAIQTNAAVALKYPEGMRDLDAEKFQAIESASTQLTSLAEDLLLLARTDQSSPQQREILDLSILIKQTLLLYQLQFEDRQIQLNAQIKENLFVAGDKVQLSRIYINLLDNALRYTPAGGIVDLQADLEKTDVIVRVKDTGIGIAPEHIEHVFERFWQADQARSYQVGGSGLGLAIVQGIIQSNGGRMTVTSELGQGSCFTIYLPAYQTPSALPTK